MTIIGELWRCINDSTKSSDEVEKAREQLRNFLRDLLESMYLARYFKPQNPPIPQPDPYLNLEPTSTPMIENWPISSSLFTNWS